MSLKQQIDTDIKKAMLAGEKSLLMALRNIKALILLEETSAGQTTELNRETELKLLQKSAKQRKESAELYLQQSRQDLADKENLELRVIESYLPAQINEEELKTIITEIIQKTGAKSLSDMGKVIGVAVKELSGKADNKKISSIVKEILSPTITH